MSTKIEWTNEVWNPMTGCTKISSGCDICYAHTVAHRRTRDIYLKQPPVRDTVAGREDPFAPRFWEDRLDIPMRWKTPRRIFVNSMSDVFHSHFTVDQIRMVFEVMNACPQHQFQLLTKRPERALRFAHEFVWTENIWMGTSIENMDVARRADALRQIPAAVRFISAEPLLGPLDALDVSGIDWIIGGGESGAGYRPVDVNWARGLRELCERNAVAFFWKQWGGSTSKSGGRDLDGRTWSEYPVQLATG
jgi:protein gp37